MKAIFDKWCNCVGWIDEKSLMVFSKEMSWIGFVKDNYFFSPKAIWLGALINGSFVDRQGKPVAWLNGSQPKGRLPLLRPLTPLIPITPLRPLRPLTPLSPLQPLAPLGGWSDLEWSTYTEQE